MTFQSAIQQNPSDSEISSPVGDRLCDALMRDVAIVASIIGLLLQCRPSHIAGFIATIVVDTINRVRRWRFRSDGVQKGRKRRAPRGVHADAAPAIVHVFARVRIETTALDQHPTLKLWRTGTRPSSAMFPVWIHESARAAKTAEAPVIHQRIKQHVFDRAAVALTGQPIIFRLLGSNQFPDDGPRIDACANRWNWPFEVFHGGSLA